MGRKKPDKSIRRSPSTSPVPPSIPTPSEETVQARVPLLHYALILLFYAAAIVAGLIPFLFLPTLKADAHMVWFLGFLILLFLAIAAALDYVADRIGDAGESDGTETPKSS